MKEWAEAFTKAQQDFPPIPKKRTADMGNYSYSYADLGDILEAVLPVLHANGLSVAQSPVPADGKVGIETRIYHISGHVESFGPLFLTAGNTPQSAGSALTYARRYALTAALGIATEDDDDARPRQEPPQREDPTPQPKEWLRNHMAVLSDWTDDQKRETVTQVMAELNYHNPMTQEQVEEVFDKTKAIYVETTEASGDSAPF